MDTHRLLAAMPQDTVAHLQPALSHLIPYAIVLANFFLFRLLRLIVKRLFVRYVSASSTRAKLSRLFLEELISTSELCASCAELNVVYEKHGSTAYGISLFLLSYLWIDSFGESYTTPGYIVEDYFLVRGNELLKSGDAYVRFIGQSLAMPLAWRFANLYWKYQLINEHRQLATSDFQCKTSLTTSTGNGFLIELTCCLVCRLSELVGQKLLEKNVLSQRAVSLCCSFACSVLVVLALELSGGYFNPVLAASLEYGCNGIEFYQHAIVFWFGPLIGHLIARILFRRYGEQLLLADWTADRDEQQRSSGSLSTARQQQVRQTARRSSAGQRAANKSENERSPLDERQESSSTATAKRQTRGSQRRRKTEKIN